MKSYKFTIVTPVYNGKEYIEQCILSVKNQTHQHFEHIIMDGGSTDGTIEILKRYEGTYPMKWISSKDHGMYDAVCNGFAMATGEIYSWLNADDTYFPWALETMNQKFQNQNVNWCTGVNSCQDARGNITYVFDKKKYRQKWIQKGYYGTALGFIQQESTFWRKELWNQAEADSIRKYRLAGDFFLWKKFAKLTNLYSVDTIVAAFRVHFGQLSGDINKYRDEIYQEQKKIGTIRTTVVKIVNKLICLI